jgi:hypothetical protein
MESAAISIYARVKEVVVRLRALPFPSFIILRVFDSWGFRRQLLPRVNSWTESCLGNGAKLNSWHLLLLGTNPDHHHKGLAAALIKAVETKVLCGFLCEELNLPDAQANNDDVMMCLETSNVKNVGRVLLCCLAIISTLLFIDLILQTLWIHRAW